MVKEINFPRNGHCGKQQYIGLRLAFHILVVTKMSPPTPSELLLTEAWPWITLSPSVTALLCLTRGYSSEWHQPQNQNLDSKSWACDVFLYGSDFSEAPKRETCLVLVHSSPQPSQYMSLEWPALKWKLKGIATNRRMLEESVKQQGDRQGLQNPDRVQNKTNSFSRKLLALCGSLWWGVCKNLKRSYGFLLYSESIDHVQIFRARNL